MTPNQFRHLVVDDESNFEDEVERHLSQRGVKLHQINIIENKRPPNVINRHPENDKQVYRNTIPGNSTYSNITNHGKK